MLRARDTDALMPWAADTNGSLLVSFGKGITADLAAVKAALTEPWSNDQTEGQITKLKLVTRQMYGRAGPRTPSRAPHGGYVRTKPPPCTEFESGPFPRRKTLAPWIAALDALQRDPDAECRHDQMVSGGVLS